VTHIIKNNDERHSLFFSLFLHQPSHLTFYLILSLVSCPFLIAVIILILAILQSDMTDEDVRDGKRCYFPFFIFSYFFLFIHLLRLRSWRIKLYEWHSQRGPRASCQSPYPLLSPLFHTVMQFLTSGTVSRCVQTR